MFENNANFKSFKDRLEARRVRITYVWQARRDGQKPLGYPKRPCDVAMLLFTGEGFQPSILNAVAIDYGPGNGFGLFIDDGSGIGNEVERIATPHKGS